MTDFVTRLRDLNQKTTPGLGELHVMADTREEMEANFELEMLLARTV